MPKKLTSSVTTTSLKLMLFLLFISILNVGAMLGLRKWDSYKSSSEHIPEGWIRVDSERVPLSFLYPVDSPLAFAENGDLEQNNQSFDSESTESSRDDFDLESIEFHKDWYRNAGGERLGRIDVYKQNGVQDLDDYIKYIDKETEFEARGQKVVIPRPKILYSIVGGEVAITVVPATRGTFDNTHKKFDYIVVKDGLIYSIGANKSETFMKNEQRNEEIFQEIISSIKFE